MGTAYTVRVLAVNTAGTGAAAEAEATAEDQVVPTLTAASVDGAVLTLTYSEALDAESKPAAGAFAVTVDGSARTVDAVALSGSAVELTLASAMASGETVTVGYTVPTGAEAAPLQDASGNAAAGFTGEAVTNDTPEPENAAPAGLPEISGTAQVGETLTRTRRRNANGGWAGRQDAHLHRDKGRKRRSRAFTDEPRSWRRRRLRVARAS